jgi:hypothetical protein
MNKCQICRKTCEGSCCHSCEIRLGQALSSILDYYQLAKSQMMPVKGDGVSGGERSLGIRVSALDFVAGFEVVDVLESWERLWRDIWQLGPYGPASLFRSSTALTGLPEATLVGVVGFLRAHLPKACQEFDFMDDFADEVYQCRKVAQNAANVQRRTAWRVTCPTDTDEGECGARIRVTGEDFDGHVTCPKCRSRWPVERLLRVVASSRHAELWLDPEAAAMFFGLSSRVLRLWAQKGIIKRRNGQYESHSIRAAIGVTA